MKVAVCYDPESEFVYGHFGHAEHFKLYEVLGEEVTPGEVISPDGAGHDAMVAFLKKAGVECVICGGIGAAARTGLDMTGIRCYGGITGYADAAVEALARGILAYNPDPTCHEHEEGHSCCGHDEGEGEPCHCSGGCCGH